MSSDAYAQFLEYKDDPAASAAFLRAFDDGYHAAMKGSHGMLDFFGPQTSTTRATMFGWIEGQSCGDEYRRRQKMRQKDEASKSKPTSP